MAPRWETRLTEKHLKLKRLMKSAGKRANAQKLVPYLYTSCK